MSESEQALPAIPAKRYFTIGEVSELCGVKPYVLRYWEQEFTQLRPMKRRGNRRYYQHHEVVLIRRIRGLLYQDGFTISGARNRLLNLAAEQSGDEKAAQLLPEAEDDAGADPAQMLTSEPNEMPQASEPARWVGASPANSLNLQALRVELEEILEILSPSD